VTRVGLGRHGQLDTDVGDPLDGLVNLFDVGLVLAVAFLIAGLGLSVDTTSGKVEPKPAAGQEKTLTTPESPTAVQGRGEAVGQVYRLPDGRLVLVDPKGRAAAP
jgi:hypothetical protein